MSQASNKVKWCLNKAKKELAEIGMHRGLVEQEQDFKSAALHIEKARHNLNAALFFQKNNYSDIWCICTYLQNLEKPLTKPSLTPHLPVEVFTRCWTKPAKRSIIIVEKSEVLETKIKTKTE